MPCLPVVIPACGDIIRKPDGSKPREVLKRPEWLKEVDLFEMG